MRVRRPALVLLILGTLLACGAPAGVSLRAEEVWARPAMAVAEASQRAESGTGQEMADVGMAGTGAVFMRLINEGQEPDRLVGGRTDVAQVLEIHQTVMEGDTMSMQMLAGGLGIPARSEVLLEPGGYHIMLIGLQRDLQAGDRFQVELAFEKSPAMTVEAEVREP